MAPRFSELNLVRVKRPKKDDEYEGYVIGSQFRDDRWIYKLSIQEDPHSTGTYDNWVPEEWLELVR